MCLFVCLFVVRLLFVRHVLCVHGVNTEHITKLARGY